MGYGSQIGEFAGQVGGDLAAMSNDAEVQRLLAAMEERWNNLPDAEKVQYAPLIHSAMGDVHEDPRFANAENTVLDRLMEMATQGGLTDADKAKIEQSKLSALDYEHGVRGRDEQLLMRRGLGNSGALLSSEVAAQQGGIDRAYKGDLDVASSAADRALQALTGAGSLATTLGSRDINMKLAAAGANDAIAKFNASRSDSEDLYNASLAQRNALAKLGGLDKVTGMEIGNQEDLAAAQRRRWRGYGKQGGALYDTYAANND
jgi:hypothetical protein